MRRSLLDNALRKKHFYKDAIRVEIMPSEKEIDPMGPGLGDWLKWDPISSGEGDLQLDEIEKAFRDSNKTSNTVKAIDFTSAVNSLPPYGMQIKELIPTTMEQEFQKDPEILCSSTEKNLKAINYTSALNSLPPNGLQVKDLIPTTLEQEFQKDPKISCSSTEKELKAVDFASALNSLPPNGLQTKDLTSTTLEQELEKDPETFCSSTEKIMANNEEPLILDGLDFETEENDLKSRICVTNYGTDLMIEDENESIGAVLLDTKIPEISMQAGEEPNVINILSSVDEQNSRTHKDVALFDDNVTAHVSVKDTEIGSACNVVASTVIPAPCSDDFRIDIKELERDCSDVILGAQNDAVDEVETDEKGKFEDIPESFFSKSFVADRSNSNPSVANTEPLEEVAVENKAPIGDHTLLNSSLSHASVSGKARQKRKTSHGVALFPFKRFLSSNTLTRKVRKFKEK